jgi:Dolichyl-phosphate-mannose-protein mannosyltransferase
LSAASKLAAQVTRNRTLVIVLIAGAIVRIVMTIAYWPALVWTDSGAYISAAFNGSPVGLITDRPSGYPFVLRVISIVGGAHIWEVTVIQHLAGLAGGLLLYRLLIRLGVRRWLAAVGTAIVVMDGYAITMEQYVMTEALTTLALVGSTFLLVGARRSARAAACAGALLAGAGLMHSAALFAVPGWLAYLFWTHRRMTRQLLSAVSSLLLPVLVYSTIHTSDGQGFGLSASDGWFLYGRIATFVDCRGAGIPHAQASLCKSSAPTNPPWNSSVFYIYSDTTPAAHLYGPISTSAVKANRQLRAFALAIIEAHPVTYAHAVMVDFLRFFGLEPGNVEPPLPLPAGLGGPDPGLATARGIAHKYYADYRTPSPQSVPAFSRGYQHLFHTARWLLLLLVCAAIAPFVVGAISGRAPPHAPEILLMLTMALGVLLGASAIVGYRFRFVLPVVPFIVGSAAVGVSDLAGLWPPGRGARA